MAKHVSPKAAGPADIHVGARIRAARLAAQMSQTELANALGITFQQVQKYEKGVNRVGMGRLITIATSVGRSLDYFVPDHKSPGSAVNPVEVEFFKDRYGMQLAQAFLKLPKEKRACLRDIAYLILEARKR